MGLISKNASSHIRNTALDDAKASQPVMLPIFGKNFEGHGVLYPNATAVRFAGEGKEGWGYHIGGEVDCINITKTKSWNISDIDSWENLYNAEVLPEELGLRNPAQAVIARLVITLNTVMYQIVQIPDPSIHAIQVLYPHNPQQYVYGTLCLRPASNKERAAYRRRLASRRRLIMENCLE